MTSNDFAIDTTLIKRNVERINSEQHKEYIQSYDNLITNLYNALKRKKEFSFTNDYSKYNLQSNKKNINIGKIHYVNLNTIKNKMHEKYDELMNEYVFEKQKYLYGGFKIAKLEDLTNKINVVKQSLIDIEELESIYENMNIQNIEKIRQQYTTLVNDKKDRYEKYDMSSDDIEKRRLLQEYINIVKMKNGNELLHDIYNMEKYKYLPILVPANLDDIDTDSSINEDETVKNDIELEKKEKSKTDRKLKKTIEKANTKAQKKKTKNQISDETDLKENHKKTLKKFLFRTLNDCNDTKHSEKHFMNKNDILEVIENNPSIKEKLPKYYKTLKKTELCKTIEPYMNT